MNKQLYYRKDQWHIIIGLDHPVEPAQYDDSLIALARRIVDKIQGCIKK